MAKAPNDFQSNLNLAQVIVDTRLAPNRRYPLFPFRKDKEWQNTFLEARRLVDIAVETAELGDNETLLWKALTARAVLFFIKGDLPQAKQECDRVLQQSPNYIGALHNRGVFALLEQDHHQALALFEKLPLDYRLNDSIVFAIARAYADTGRPDKVVEILDEYVQGGGSIDDLRVKVFKAEAWIAQGEPEEANKIKQELLQAKPHELDTLQAVSFISELQNNFDEAIQYLMEAYSLPSGNEIQLDEIGLRLATLYYSHRDFQHAAEWFDKLSPIFLEDRSLARAYIQSLHATKRYADTYRISRNVRELGVTDPTVVEIESWLAEYFGDLETALQLEVLLTELEPYKLSHQLQRARIEFRSGRQQEAKELLASIDANQLKNPIELIQVAELYTFFGEPKTAIELAYRARHLGQDSPEIHLAYTSLFLRLDDDLKILHPDSIESDTAIYLVGENSRWIKILSIVPANEANWEFAPDSVLGKLLIGKHVGDLVTLKSGPLENLDYRIREVQSIYVRAFQETFDEFGTRFPEHPGLYKMKVIDQDLTKFFIFIYQHSAHAENVYKIYKEGLISVEQFANFVNRALIDVYTSLQGLKEQRVYASFGSEEDQKKQTSTIGKAIDVTLDLTGLFTLSYLELLPTFTTRFQRIYISQRLLDELEIALADRYFELKKGRRTIGFHEGRPFFEEFAPSVVENNIQYLHNLIQYCRNHCEVIPIPPESVHYLELPEDPMQNIGRESISSILVARHTDTAIFADDARLRTFAEQNHQVSGFWTQSLLQDMEIKGVIGHDIYVKECVRLLEADYFFTSINENLILDVLELSHYTSDHRLTAILKGLYGPEAIEEIVIPIVAKLLKKVWLSAITKEKRLFILDQVLPALCKGRNRRKVLLKLVRLVEVLLYITPLQRKDLVDQINLWYQAMSTVGGMNGKGNNQNP